MTYVGRSDIFPRWFVCGHTGIRSPGGVTGAEATMTLLETGQTVRWRGTRWRVLGKEEGGFLRLVGVDAAFKDIEVTPLQRP